MTHRFAGFTLACISLTALAAPAAAEQVNLSFYGTPGLIDMPSAVMMPDGDLAFTVTRAGGSQRNTLTFQITPRLYGSFRYAIIDGYETDGGDRFDRSFDVTYLMIEEGRFRPAIAVGLRDFAGTGIYSSEFVAATKSFGPKFRLTGGIGWGRLGERNSFDNPLGVFGDYFDTRPASGTGGISQTGRLDFDNWFRGPAALFAGLEYMPNDRTRFVIEYSSDEYSRESGRGVIDQKSPLNFSVSHRLKNGIDLELSYLYGTEIGLRFSYVIDPRRPAGGAGIESAPEPIRPRDAVAAASWGLDDRGRWQGSGSDRLRTRLEAQDLRFEGMEREGSTLTLYIGNGHYGAPAQAVGRAARVLANVAPPEVETFRIVTVENGIALNSVTLARRDLEAQEFALDGSWDSFALARIDDGYGLTAVEPRPRFSYDLRPYLDPSFFDPDNPLRADLGLQLQASWSPTAHLVFAGGLRLPLAGNLDSSTRASDSILPHVRSDFAIYDRETDIGLTYLTGEYFFRPGQNLYGRVTAGYLERMYAGLSTEVLWRPSQGRLALGAEMNYAVQRDFDGGFGLQDYDIATGHASAYYDFGKGYLAQVDVGRYLAGDYGATLTLKREFANGFTVGGFMTLTDVSFDDFGEGSFDKGVMVTIPIAWLSGRPSTDGFTTVLRPVLRDGGARLEVRNRLYEVTSGHVQSDLQDDWGRFWR
ncbi:YjbH domain-containing protein [Xinfangfangia pollutisoli]|uniref:YjbH domain-containing protein n=1 Tax=Xinfangfangia pollutisoli TaxID=2865960 RepID=UPI001CD19BC8|nr:YjbH domain-containing protein [Xinfangfangia pollutisoli]